MRNDTLNKFYSYIINELYTQHNNDSLVLMPGKPVTIAIGNITAIITLQDPMSEDLTCITIIHCNGVKTLTVTKHKPSITFDIHDEENLAMAVLSI